jgi:hypothetical protein
LHFIFFNPEIKEQNTYKYLWRERAFTSRSGERERFRRKEREKELFGRDPARKFFSFKIFVPNTRWVQFHHPRKRPVPLRNLPNTDYTTSSLITQINKSNLKKTQISFYKKKREKDSIIHTQAYQQETEPPRPRCAAALPGPSCPFHHPSTLPSRAHHRPPKPTANPRTFAPQTFPSVSPS